jgi:U4/U6.U5 tri-snRNP-associated protein 1
MASAISIEETNRLRISLGLAPLPVPGAGPVFKDATKSSPDDEEVASTLESRQAESYANYKKLQDAEEAKRKREAKAEAIKKARDASRRFAKLEGKGLGEADEDDQDAKSWLIKQKKRQREIEKARKLEKERVEAEKEAEYTGKDLAGVKVGHELGTFQEGEDHVLTLKDTTIDENEEEGDELENTDLREREKLKDLLELKKKKPVYNPNDIDDSEDRTILSHYDVEIEGKKSSRFTLDGQGSTKEQLEAIKSGTAKGMKPKAISLDFLSKSLHGYWKRFSANYLREDEPSSDYIDAADIKIRKPKKKKAKSTRQRAVDEDDIVPPVDESPADSNDMEIDSGAPIIKKRTYEDVSFVDDDDLQASLAAQRRNALKKRKRVRPEDIAKQLRAEAATPDDTEEEEATGLVIDETSEFVANLQKPEGREVKRPRVAPQHTEIATIMGAESDEEGDVNMEQQSYANVEDHEDLQERLKREEENNISSMGMDDEATLDKGLGSTLKLLKDRGILKTSESGDRNAIFREKQLFLAEKQRREAAAELKARQQRERDRATGRLDRMSAREKEDYARQQNTYRDQQESRQLAEHFNKEYRPNVELKYTDEFGRNMNQKEAFKHLSHQFHGKGSGKQKTEKLLKKIEDEKRREAQSLLDSSQLTGMSGAVGQQLKKQRQAGVRLA